MFTRYNDEEMRHRKRGGYDGRYASLGSAAIKQCGERGTTPDLLVTPDRYPR
jgi:hypothetical protein